MIWDIHVHVAGVGSQSTGNFLAPRFQRSLACRLFMRRLGVAPSLLNTQECDGQIAQIIVSLIEASQVDRSVLLAFDAAYHVDGTRHQERTLMVTDNDFVAGLAAVPMVDNLGLVWVFIEATTVVSALLVGINRTPEALEAAWKYLILGTVGVGVVDNSPRQQDIVQD